MDGPRNLDVTALYKVNKKTITSKTSALIQAVARPVQHQLDPEVEDKYHDLLTARSMKARGLQFE